VARIITVKEQVEREVPAVPTEDFLGRMKRTSSASSTRAEYSGLHYNDGWRRNSDDQLLLESVTRLGAMSMRQAHRYIYPTCSWRTVRKRINYMVQAGLLARMDSVLWAGVIIYPTPAGRRAGILDENSPLRAMEPPAESSMMHRLLAAEYALTYIAAGATIITEREARAFENGDAILNTEARDQFLYERGVVRGGNGERGVNPSADVVGNKQVERWLTLPLKDGHTNVRIPDFLVVTKRGELRAVEVEPTPKAPSRARSILTGYREHCLQHNPVPRGADYTLKTAGAHYGQFQSVQWIVSDAVDTQMRGHSSGFNPITGKPDKGLVREVWDASSSTHLFFHNESSWSLDNPNWPVSVMPLDVSEDAGLEYAVAQRNLPATYRTSMVSWRVWRELWHKDMTGEEEPVPFTQWIRFPGVLAECRKHSA